MTTASDTRIGDMLASSDLDKIIKHGDTDLLVATAQQIGERIQRERVTTSQIRNIFGEVRIIEQQVIAGVAQHQNPATSEPNASIMLLTTEARQLKLLRPKLAYQSARHTELKGLAEILSASIDRVDTNAEYFRNFVDFFEAILAYHRFYGGK